MIKEYERELNELQEGKLISKEDLHEGDEIIYNGEHYFVTLTDTGTAFVWITDDESERYNRNAQGWTVKADWIDEVIGQPEEDELKESLTKSDRDIILDVVKGKYETGHGYLEDKRDYEEALGRRLTDAKYEQLEEFYSDLMDLGPEGFYEEYKDMLDFDPDFIAEYGYSEDDEEEDELEEAVKTSDRYEVARYSRFWYGIMDNHTNLLLRAGPNADYSKPLDKENNKLLLFHSKEEAQSYIDSNLNSKQDLKESTVNESDKSDKLEEFLKEDLSTRKERYKKFNRILALRAADTDEQKEAIKAIESTLDNLGIKAYYGTSSGQPKTVIFDVGKHYNAIYVHADGTVLIGGEEEGEVDPDNKEEVKQMLIDHGFIGNGINESRKDFAFMIKCNDGPKELVKVVAENKSKAEKYAKDMYAANHVIYADDRYNVWSIEDKNRSLKEDYQDVDSMPRRNLMDEIDDIYRWARQSHRTGIISMIEDPEVFPNEEGEEGYFKGVPTDKLKSILKTLRKMKYDSMSREELMDEIDSIYRWALKGKHIDITSIIEDPEVFSSTDEDNEEGYFKGVPTDKLRGILKILRKMKDGGSLTKDDERVFLSKNGSVNESLDFTNAADVRHRLDRYPEQYLTITFRGSYDWKYISDLLEEYNDGDEEEADLALDKLEAIYGSEFKLLNSLEVEEISEITVYDSDVLVTIKVDKDDLQHNFSDHYADLINMPSIDIDTIKILELDKPIV